MRNVQATVHSILSPSGSDRWSTCLGALAACKGQPEQPSGPAALLGTAKHAVSECILREPERQSIDGMCGQTWYLDAAGEMVQLKPESGGYAFTIDDEFCDHVKVYIDYVNSRPGQKMYETWVSTAHIFGVAGQGGTIDCLHLNHAEREIEIIDAKFGYVPVSAKHRQLRIYGAAELALHDLDGEWDYVRCTIAQPQDKTEPIKSERFTRAEIEAFVADMKPKAQTAHTLWLSPPPDLLKYLTPSEEACAWCPINGNCVARTNRIVDMFQDCSLDEKHNPFLLTDARIGELYSQTADIVEWANAIAAEAESRALRGVAIPEHKLVWGRKGKRVYIEGSKDVVATTLEMTLGEDAMYEPRKLKSPTQVEEALKAANAPGLYAQIKPFVTQADPKLRLVPLTDKGDAVTIAKVEFGEVT